MMFYKRKIIEFCGISILLIVFVILLESYPASHKEGEKYEELTFSKESGFYENEFELEIKAEHGTIYYTLDGSIPDRNSIKYEGPIEIKDATQNDNAHSMRTDVSTGFDRDEIEKISFNCPEYSVPDYKIDKATIVRAVVYDEIGQRSDVKTASYFVGFSHKSGYEGMNILSLVTEPSNLFDYETGIYVTGKTYDDYVKKYRYGDEYYWREEFWALWMANYRNRGIKWERKATCQFFDESKELICDQECGIRIHGSVTRGYNPKSLNIYAREEYDGNKTFRQDFWDTGYYATEITMFQGGNDIRTKAKDYLISEAIESLNVSTMHYEPYVMFLDGEYWGCYWLNEKYNANYFEFYYNVNKDNVIMIKNGEVAEGEEEDFKYYSNMLEYCSQSDVTDIRNYQKVCELIDIESYIDYYAVMLYLGRSSDWPWLNYALWRTEKSEVGKYGDGKWRWIIFDLNSDGYNVEFDSIKYVMDNDDMFKNMMTNDNFRTQLFLKIEELANTVFAPAIIDHKIMEYQNFIMEPMKKNDKRFFGDDSLAEFNAEMDLLKLFFAERKDVLMPILDDYK